MSIRKKTLTLVLSSAAILTLAGCGVSTKSASSSTAPGKQTILSVRVTSADSRAAIAAKFGGEILAWHPEDGFAQVLSSQPKMSAQAVSSANGKIITPEAAGFKTWSGGFKTWSGGFKTWSGGFKTWSGGFKTWSGGFKTWSGGFKTWSGGFKTWSGGFKTWSGSASPLTESTYTDDISSVPFSTPSENNSVFQQIRLPAAHAISRYFGGGVKIAVIDTGLDTAHEGFAYNLVPSSEWKDFVDNDNDPSDVPGGAAYGHGTAVAGIILQLAPSAGILPIRVLNSDGNGDLDNVIKAVDYAVAQGAQIINLSLGSDQDTYALLQMFEYAKSKGTFIVASAGNESLSNITYPARYSNWSSVSGNLFGVGSVDSSDKISTFSNYSSDIFGWAPGEKIATFYPDNQVVEATGTSFAAPLLTGALALAIGDSPTYDAITKTSESLKVAMEKFINDPLLVSGISYRSNGRLDVERLIRSIPGWAEPSKALSGADLIKNGNFESGAANSWTLSSAKVSNDRFNFAYRGNYGLQVDPSGTASYTVTGLSLNTNYSFSVWTKVRDLGDKASISLKTSTVSELRTVVNSGDTTTNNAWVRNVINFNSGSSHSATIQVAKTSGYGPVSVDLLSLVAQ